MKTVEISGIRLEIDERTARTVDSYKVGDKVKVLVKEYGSSYSVCPGVIVGFSNFKALPTIEVMYLKGESWEADAFKFAYINTNNDSTEICPFNEIECVLDKQSIVDKFDRAIERRASELTDMRYKREFFIKRFATAFEGAEPTAIAVPLAAARA